MGIFDVFGEDWDKAQVFGRTPFMNEPGQYKVRIDRHVWRTSQRDKTKVVFVVEFTVLESSRPDMHPVGCHRNNVVTIRLGEADKNSAKFGGIKAHFAAVAGCEPEEVDSEFMRKVTNNPTMFEGRIVHLEVMPQIKTRSGQDFTPRNWYPVKQEAIPTLPAPEGTEILANSSLDEAPF